MTETETDELCATVIWALKDSANTFTHVGLCRLETAVRERLRRDEDMAARQPMPVCQGIFVRG